MQPTHKNKNSVSKAVIKRLLFIIFIIGCYVYITIHLPLPTIKPSLLSQQSKIAASNIVWPSIGEAAVGIEGSKTLQSHGQQTMVPTASTAKLITALSVLKIKPLKLGQQGPLITISANDVAIYNKYVSEQGSVVPVKIGEKISEYQLLQGMMLPSANNMADTLAIWAFGSLKNYSSYANQYCHKKGLLHTHVGSDASGYLPNTVSTAQNLVKLGEDAISNPVLASIVQQKTANNIPVVGTISNINQLLGVDHIIGIKTGNSNQAGGVYVSASKVKLSNNHQVTIVTTLANAPDLYDAMTYSLPLIKSAQTNFSSMNLLTKNQNVGTLKLPWGRSIPIIAANNLINTYWNGDKAQADVHVNNINLNHIKKDLIVGYAITHKAIYNNSESIPLKLKQPINMPSIWWRVTHPFTM